MKGVVSIVKVFFLQRVSSSFSSQSQTLSALANDDRANYDLSVSETGNLLILTDILWCLVCILQGLSQR